MADWALVRPLGTIEMSLRMTSKSISTGRKAHMGDHLREIARPVESFSTLRASVAPWTWCLPSVGRPPRPQRRGDPVQDVVCSLDVGLYGIGLHSGSVVIQPQDVIA